MPVFEKSAKKDTEDCSLQSSIIQTNLLIQPVMVEMISNQNPVQQQQLPDDLFELDTESNSDRIAWVDEEMMHQRGSLRASPSQQCGSQVSNFG